MRYELKRRTTLGILTGSLMVFIAVWGTLMSDNTVGDYIKAGILALLGVDVIIVLVRSKEPKLIFDEEGFSIGEAQYSYSNIDHIDCFKVWVKGSTKFVYMHIGNKTVYKFDCWYKNYGKFVKQLTLHGVEHNL